MKTAMKLSQTYRKGTKWLVEEMDGDLLLFNPDNVTTVHLNGPSSIIWELCDGDTSVAQIIESLSSAYPGQSEQITKDVIDVVADLEQQNLIELIKQS